VVGARQQLSVVYSSRDGNEDMDDDDNERGDEERDDDPVDGGEGDTKEGEGNKTINDKDSELDGEFLYGINV
jgi:hypothetical protein